MTNKIVTVICFYLILVSCEPEGEMPNMDLEYAWSGAPTDSSIVISFKTAKSKAVSVAIYERESRDNKPYASETVITEIGNYYVGKAYFTNLQADTHYYYAIHDNQGLRILTGECRTFPSGPSAFTFAFASCAETGSGNRVFNKINALEPLFYMNIGDFHYENIEENCEYNFAEAYFDILSSPPQRRLYSEHPFIYMWDDHDYGPNNSAADAPCRDVALRSYRNFIPHYALHFGDSGPVSQSFDVGRVKFILTDLRSHKIRPEYDECTRLENGTNFGSGDHINWFFSELIEARNNGQIVAWVNPIPWISSPESPMWQCDEKDDWGGYPQERQLIANFIQDNMIPLFILSGDAHMLAIDDGTNTDFAKASKMPVPLFHAAPLDNVGIVKGGPYSHGTSIRRGQFGLVEVYDSGGSEICITFKGMDSSGKPARNVRGQVLTYSFCRTISVEFDKGN